VLEIDAETGKLISSWGADTFVVPHGISIDRDNNVFLTDVGLQQVFKIPHLRNLYDKVGMFGNAPVSAFRNSTDGYQGPQVRGTGFLNDGSLDTVFRFLNANVFKPTLTSGFPVNNPDGTRRDVEQYVLAFDTDLAPIVGQQVTLTSTTSAAAGPRVTLLEQRAGTKFTSKILGGAVVECDVVATLTQPGVAKRFLFHPSKDAFVSGDGKTSLPDAMMRGMALVPGQEVTFTAVPPGSGLRIAQGS